MKTAWIVAAAATARRDWGDWPQQMKDVAPIWGSWKTWMTFGTDNVICHDLQQSRNLMGRAFHAVCNFYVYQEIYQELGSPRRVMAYDGQWGRTCSDIEDIVAMHLVQHHTDLVLLLGFDLAPIRTVDDDARDRKGMILSIMGQSPAQWVAIDHNDQPDAAFANLANFTRDTMPNVLRLLSR